MKKALLLKMLLFLSSGLIVAQTNLAINGGFEEGIDSVWALDKSDNSEVEYALSTDSPQEGLNCLQANITTLGENPWSVQIKNPFGPVEETKNYKATIWAKSATEGATINFTIGKATAGYNEYGSSYNIALTTQWQMYTVDFTAEVSTTDDITLALHITSTATYWFDNFSVVELEKEITPAIIPSRGNTVTIEFRDQLALISDEDQLPFLVYSDEKYYEVASVKSESEPTKITLTLVDKIEKGTKIKIEYIPGTLQTKAGIELEGFIYNAVNNSTYVAPVATHSEEQKSIKVFPTVVSDILSIENPSNENIATISFYSTTGKCIKQIKQINDSMHIDLSHIAKNTYLIIIEKSNSTTQTFQIIKK